MHNSRSFWLDYMKLTFIREKTLNDITSLMKCQMMMFLFVRVLENYDETIMKQDILNKNEDTNLFVKMGLF